MNPSKHTIFLLVTITLWLGWAGLTIGQVKGARILGITVEGNRRSEASLILTMSGLRVGERVTGEDIQDAIRQLYSLGIFDDIQILAQDQTPEGINLKIVVREFPVLKELSIKGNKRIDLETIKGKVNLVRGQVISPWDIKRGQRQILSLYREKGYLLATVTPKVSESEGGIELKYEIKEGKKAKVRKIEILGNFAFMDEKIKDQMKTKEDRWWRWRSGDFKGEQFQEDLKHIVQFYRKRGYRDAEVTEHSITYDITGEYVDISITLFEGRQYRMGQVRWEGNQAYSTEQLSQFLKFREGDIYNQEQFDQTLDAIYLAYQEEGYLYVNILPQEEVKGEVIDFTFRIREGKPARVRRINITGNTKTKEKVIRRELVIKPGDLFRRSAVERSQREIYQLNFFQDVRVIPQPLENGDVDLTFEVEEKPTGQANIAAGYSERDGPIGTIGISIPNLFGNGQRLDFSWDFGTRYESINMGFTEPWFLDTPTSVGFDFYKFTRTWTGDYDEKRTGGVVRVGRRLTWPDDYFRVYWKYRLEEVEYIVEPDYPDPAGLRDIHWPQVTSSMAITVLRDSRDLPEFSTKGSLNSYGLEFAGGPLQGNVEYHKHVWDSNWFLKTLWNTVLLLKRKGGFVQGLRSPNDVPFSERFFPGGVSYDGVIRGYSDRSVGPRIAGREIGGRSMLIFTAELRFPLVERQLYGILFADAGNAWETFSDMNPFDLKRSVGFGFRIVVPMLGLIGFDIGYGLDEGGGRWRPHFQMGRSF